MTPPPSRPKRAFRLTDGLLLALVLGIVALALTLGRRRHAEVGSGSEGSGAGSATPPSSATSTPPTTTASGARGQTARAASDSALPVMARKPAPTSVPFQGCPPEGDGGDPALNRLKNRVDSAAWLPVTLETVLGTTWPRRIERRDRARWRPAELAEVARSEGLPLAVEGYFVGAKVEGPESPNCHGADSTFRDWHLWIAATPGRDRTRSVVVETTPAVRALHPAWTRARINRLMRDSTRVRVSGWLLLDPEHPDQVGKTRGTIWELHPVMRIEAEMGGVGRWVPLDSVPEARGGRTGGARRARSHR